MPWPQAQSLWLNGLQIGPGESVFLKVFLKNLKRLFLWVAKGENQWSNATHLVFRWGDSGATEVSPLAFLCHRHGVK